MFCTDQTQLTGGCITHYSLTLESYPSITSSVTYIEATTSSITVNQSSGNTVSGFHAPSWHVSQSYVRSSFLAGDELSDINSDPVLFPRQRVRIQPRLTGFHSSNGSDPVSSPLARIYGPNDRRHDTAPRLSLSLSLSIMGEGPGHHFQESLFPE